jgi:ABC-2 type transport system permease protein
MRRLIAMIVKEAWALLRDPKSRVILILPPLLQLFIFTFATTLDVRNVDVGIYNRSNGTASVDLVQRIAGSPNFKTIVSIRSESDLREMIDRQKVIAAIIIDDKFDRDVAAHRPASIGVVLDGRRSNAAQIVAAYISQIAATVDTDARVTDEAGGTVVTNWFNPSLDFIWFTLPSLIAIIVSVSGLSITSQAIARERELGTFDQLMVSPLRVPEILIGKMIPPMVVGMVNGTIYLIVAPLLFGVPFTGSLLLFYLSLLLYMLSLVGVGLFVSSLSMTQQQAFLGSFVATVPIILLSGYASPIENMPGWMQPITYLNPTRYFLIIDQGLFLKAMPASAVFHQLWPLALIAVATLSAAAWLFRARME